jgi:hypothetical protein
LVLHAQQADLGQLGLGNLLAGVGYMGRRRKAGEGHFHIRLPGGEPHVADQQVGTSEFGAAMDRERKGAAGRLRLEPGLPQAKAGCSRCDGLVVKRECDLLRRRGLAPHMDGHVTLQYGMIGNYAGKPHFGSQGCTYQTD